MEEGLGRGSEGNEVQSETDATLLALVTYSIYRKKVTAGSGRSHKPKNVGGLWKLEKAREQILP